ncbi:sulfurtransferase TusA family protein [Methylobacterium sp. CB376]|uniref:sulfurtransferase TusA family protein n=1 Tax=unclassified Methylobacterium TaxID=2615210 RepID=UPI0002E0CA0A|nr:MULTISPECIES: sulfurtransferase TusA family protein [Methylobacterium]WFT79449.1 sulfurtransferase TusA family protein [Methylobacterium nodulans]
MSDTTDESGADDLDLRGLKCPLPVLRTRKALRALPPGRRLVVRCTDPLAAIDIPHLLHETGDRLEAAREAGGVLVFEIRRAAADG